MPYGIAIITDDLRTVNQSPGCGTGPRLKNQSSTKPPAPSVMTERHRVDTVPGPVGLGSRISVRSSMHRVEGGQQHDVVPRLAPIERHDVVPPP